MLADSQSRQQTPQGGKIVPDKWPVMPFFNSMSPDVWLGDRTCVQLIDVTAKILSTKCDGVSVEHTPQPSSGILPPSPEIVSEWTLMTNTGDLRENADTSREIWSQELVLGHRF